MDDGPNGPRDVTRTGSAAAPAVPPSLQLPDERQVLLDRGQPSTTDPPAFLSLDPPEVRAPRAGPPRMPTLSNPAPGAPSPRIRSAAQTPLDLLPPTAVTETRPVRRAVPPADVLPPPPVVQSDRATPRSDDGSPFVPPGEFEVRKDHPVRTEIPPLTLDPGKVEIEVEGARRRVRIMTTGVFDIIHLGHIHMLEAARALGDELYVVIARDDTVRRMKHEPLNPEEVRRQIVQGMRPVTKAVLGHVGDIYRSVVDIRPDVIALGYDQKFTDDEVRRECAQRGVAVRVVRLPQFDHDLDATRKIIERIAERAARNELYTHREA